jgi:hypothetical protein
MAIRGILTDIQENKSELFDMELSNIEIYYNYYKIILIIGIIIAILVNISKKSKKYNFIVLKVVDWFRHKYYNNDSNKELPLYSKKIAKPSPYITAQAVPMTNNFNLDNLQFGFNIPYRRLSDNLSCDEHKITITTIVQNYK